MTNTSLFTKILVFKTNLESETDCQILHVLFETDAQIVSWNVDLEDTDRVLRIESASHSSACIIQKVTQAGYICEELPD